MPAVANQVNTINVIGNVSDTTANWLTNDFVIPAGVWAVDTTTGKIKLGDGITTYSLLPVKIDAALPPEYRAMLNMLFSTADGGKTYTPNLGVVIPNAPIIADGTGKILQDALPDFLFNTVEVVGNIAARDALADTYHNSSVLVVDATGDPTVTTGGAMYCWYDPGVVNGTDPGPGWHKIASFAEMDVNWDAALVNCFKYQGPGAQTLDNIADGTVYQKTTFGQVTKLNGIEALADVTTATNVRAAGAYMTSDTYIANVMSAATLKAAIAAGVNNAVA